VLGAIDDAAQQAAAPSGPQEVDAKTIARMCLEASDEVLESLPHIGPTHRVHLQAWARKILGV
jgi:hypothetical protein